ncbi:glycine--tRNA ligase subunit beta [Symbiobacterium thermophilum]|uniref:Glycine--tRNA ligase beta subunit n=1 Tax=Symbiobacterium thermophilum TaxID=2734 RepID=A0A953IDF9_SYMTR|nr:glycine--tRNA ligase subunit beta [Symbiobacterium thermophilum]MBY6276280.1 glycine--tRNA ligase subunit beta [Symbiobacterium thermophilum]
MAETRNLILEIGTEEIPARFCAPALEQLKENAAKALAEARLDYELVDVFGTPRRLVLYVRNLALRQRDVEVEVKGPPRKIAFDAEGNFTVPARKFAEGQGVALEELEVRPDEKGGEYLWARKRIQGESVETVLPPLLAGLVTSIHWPKAMRWADRELRYARPIKWILALLGDWRVPFDVDGIETVSTTRGHRVLGPAEPIAVSDADDYFAKVAGGYVMVDQAVRKQVIWQQVTAEAARVGGFVRRDEDLLEELTWLVEQPTAFAGSFDPAFLEVPAEVLVTTMKDNQRYFPVYKAEGSEELLPYFIGVRNGGHEHLDIVRAGNEKVLAARLSDARFFWDEDRRQPLESFNARLKEAVFQEKLGTQFERVERLVSLSRPIAQALGLSPEQEEQAARAAWLCKADLMTRMVFEFPEVQGYMGKQYLLHQGGDPAVAEAIYEHYLPRGAGDDLPRTGPGIVVALADKLDTLAGYFSIGLIPTGSQDPFALRRAAQGVVQTLVENGLRVDLAALVSRAIEQYRLPGEAAVKTHSDLMEFFRARVKVLMEQREIRYDVIDAVLAAGFRDVTDAVNRAEALAAVMAEPEFAAVTGAFKRVANLAGKANEAGAVSAEIDPELFTEPAERDLYGAFVDLRPEMKRAYEAGDYREFYHLATRLKAPVDAFLDTVRVNVEDEKVRANRYALLQALGGLLSAPADLNKLAG